jgi:predicted O-linked N-acetylglucosamine transferase (SPINDLY family)
MTVAANLLTSGDDAGARAALEQAIAMEPRRADARNNLGVACKRLGDFAAALAHFDAALVVAPLDAAALHNRGATLIALGRLDEAAENDGRLLRVATGDREARRRLERTLAALEARDGKGAQPVNRVAQMRRAWQWKLAGRFDRAVRLYDGPLAKDPTARVLSCCAELTLAPESAESARRSIERYARKLRALSLDPKALAAGGFEGPIAYFAPAALAYLCEDCTDLQAELGRLVAQAAALCGPRAKLAMAPKYGEKIRVGFVSAFFCEHTHWRIPLKGWIEGLDRRRFEIFGYSLADGRDEATAAAEAMCDGFVGGRHSIAEWRMRIQDDAPHVLIYPGLWLDDRTYLLAAQRLAPLQCVGLGHPLTSGLPTIDVFLSCDAMEPRHGEAQYTERLVRLPGLSAPIDARTADLPVDREKLGLRSDATVFWTGHAPAKFSPRFDDVFPGIAARARNVQFAFTRIVDAPGSDERFEQRLEQAFAGSGLCWKDYCVLLPATDPAAFRARMGAADIYLDCLGWSGFNTTIDALASDLPIVCALGATMRSRHTSGVMAAMGLAGDVAPDVEAYLARALALAEDGALRSAARERIATRKADLLADRSSVAALEAFLAGWFR